MSMEHQYTVDAEYDELDAVRVHRPNVEAFVGTLDPEPNLFFDTFSVPAAQEEHDRMVETLRGEGVDVHYLYDDLAGGTLDGLLDEFVDIETGDLAGWRRGGVADAIYEDLLDLPPRKQMQAVLSRATLVRHPPVDGQMEPSEEGNGNRGLGVERRDSMSILMREPLTNIYFQRDQQMVTDQGVVLSRMRYNTRRPEVDLARRAWEEIGAAPLDPVPDGEYLEGGEFLPAGDFALIGADSPDGQLLRTSYAAVQAVLQADAVGYDEVGVVRAPKKKADTFADELDGEADMDIMHLDTWFNIPGEGIAVVNEELAASTEVDVYRRRSDGYPEEPDRTEVFADYLDDKDYTTIDIPPHELPQAANFLTIDDRKVVPVYLPGDDGAYDPAENQTIEAMRREGVEVVPDGQGLDLSHLTNGYGGVHCMTTPLSRR